MMHIYNLATMARALTLELDPQLHTLLVERIAALVTADYDLTGDTEYLVIEPGETEADIVRHVGFSPLVEPIDGARFGDTGFHPFWDRLLCHGAWYEMIVTFGSTFAYVLLIQGDDSMETQLRSLCQAYAS